MAEERGNPVKEPINEDQPLVEQEREAQQDSFEFEPEEAPETAGDDFSYGNEESMDVQGMDQPEMGDNFVQEGEDFVQEELQPGGGTNELGAYPEAEPTEINDMEPAWEAEAPAGGTDQPQMTDNMDQGDFFPENADQIPEGELMKFDGPEPELNGNADPGFNTGEQMISEPAEPDWDNIVNEIQTQPDELYQGVVENIENNPLLTEGARQEQLQLAKQVHAQDTLAESRDNSSSEIVENLKERGMNPEAQEKALNAESDRFNDLLDKAQGEGMSSNTRKELENVVNKIKEQTQKDIGSQMNGEPLCKQVFDSAKEEASKWLHEKNEKVKAWTSARIENGINAVKKFGNGVGKAVENAKIRGESAFTPLKEKTAQIHRGYMSFDYKCTKLCHGAEKGIADMMQKASTWKQEMGNRFQNAGRVLLGKDLKEFNPQEPKGKVYNFFRDCEKQDAKHMGDVKKDFCQSYNKSMSNIKSLQKERSEHGMKDSKGLANVASKTVSQAKKFSDNLER